MTNIDQFPVDPSAQEVAKLTVGQQAMATMMVRHEAQLVGGTVPNEYDAMFADIHDLVHGTDDQVITVPGTGVRTPAKTGMGADLYAVGQANKEAAAKAIGLDTQQYEAARSQGLLRPTVGNDGEIGGLSDARRKAIVAKIS